MARIEYGHTWWGRRWLESLSGIDFENRLPRGKRYARNGSVAAIEIEGTTVSAKVKGRQSAPYRVALKLWEFSKKEKKALIDLVKGNPYYLSQLEARMLPPELEEESIALGIRLFPGSFKDLGMRCSCPDWAVPCKHLAAVVYIIANEIDKNPFMVFRMHGLDLLEAAGRDPAEEEEILGIESFLAAKPEEYNYYREKLEHIDLSSVPDLYPASSRLLTEFPLFYPKNDFKQVLLGVYKRLSKETKKYVKAMDLREEPPKLLYSTCAVTMYKGKYRFAGKLKKGENELAFDSDDVTPLVEYLKILSAGDLSAYPPVISFLIMVHGFVLKLMEMSAAVPDIISIKKGSYIIRWLPALFNPEIKSIVENLSEAVPREIVKYGKTPLEHREQVLFLITFFFNYYLQFFSVLKPADADPITNLFFSGEEYIPKKFEERENAKTIHLWLGRFFIRPVHYRPVIHIEENPDKEFTFEIRVRDLRSEEDVPMTFSDFMKKPESETLPLLRDLSLLATYLETVNDFLRRGKTVTVGMDTFLEGWFSALPALRTLGVNTVVPKKLREAFTPGLSLQARAKKSDTAKVVTYTSIQDLLDFNWSIAVGDSFISPGELLRLKERYGRFLRYKDMFLEFDEKHLESISRQLEKEPVPSPLELLKAGLTGKYQGVPLDADENTKELFDSLLAPPEVSPPGNLTAVLRPYQLRGFQWLYHNYRIGLGSVVADDMGLGKTVQVIAFLQQLKDDGALSTKKPALIVVPASLMTNWAREIKKFAPEISAEVYHGAERNLPDNADLVITTYALVRGDKELLAKRKWSVAVIDEAQNIKNSVSAQAKAVKSIKAEYRIAMTGTPVENRLLDYWSILDYVMKGYMGGKTSFKDEYAVPIERYRDRAVLDKFRMVTAPLIMRRLKTDKKIIQDLPDKIVTNRYPGLTKEQAALYDGLVNQADEWLEDAEGINRSGIVFKLMTGLKQICCHPRIYTKRGCRGPEISGKAEMLVELLTTLAERGEKALVFTQFAEMGELLKEIIEEQLDSPCLFLYGGTTRKERDRMVDAFQEDPDVKCMVLSIKAGGVGLNLTAANHVVHYDLWWNPAVENQATDRAFRIGQSRDVTVYRLITRATFEEKINEMLEAKEELANLAVSQGEKWLTKLSTGELKELIALTESRN